MSLVPPHVDLGPDDTLLIEAARDYARSELLPLEAKWDRDESSAYEVVPHLSEMGFLSMLIPESQGGVGCSYRTYAAILHELASWSPSVCVMLAVHNMVGLILQRRASEALQAELLPGWGLTENFGAFAISEAGAGSDPGSSKTTAVEVEGGFRINGEKMWVTNGMNARWLLILVRLQGGSHAGALCSMMVDGQQEGIERTKIRGKMGIRGSETAVISFHDTFVPRKYLLGEYGQGLEVSLAGLNGGRIGIAAQATGIAQACLFEMINYARQREQFGQPIGRYPAVGAMIADSAVELEAAKALVWRAAWRVDMNQTNRAANSMAKLFAAECANRIAYRAVQVHGGAGYVNECRVERLFRDARITPIYEGTSEIQRIVIGREMAGGAPSTT